MHAGQVIDMQHDFLVRFTDPYFRRIVKTTLSGGADSSVIPNPGSYHERLVEVVENHVKNAYAYHVNEEMADLVQHAADMLDDEDVIDLSLPPTQIGLVRFDKPLIIRDARGKHMKIHWMTWGPGTVQTEKGMESGILTTAWNDLEDPDEVALSMFDPYSRENQKYATKTISTQEMVEHLDEFKRACGRWSVVGTSLMFGGDPLDGKYLELKAETAKQIEDEGDEPHSFTNSDRLIHALWLLMNQTIVDVSEEDLTGPFKRRAIRKNLPARVTIIKLRRTSHSRPAEGESHVEWSHRWIVRGHWRWQPYGEGRRERKRIWVHAHQKGPDDKPLVVSEKVYSLVR